MNTNNFFYKYIRKCVKLVFIIVTLRPIRFFVKKCTMLRKLRTASRKANKPVIIYVSYFDFKSALIQRPHHILRILSEKGYPTVAFCSNTKLSKDRDHLFLLPFSILEFITNSNLPKILLFTYGSPFRNWKITNTTLTFYELIDDFDLIENKKTIPDLIKMFNQIANRQKTWTLVSADRLREKAISYGVPSSKILISKNGVNIEDFTTRKKDIPEFIKQLVTKGKPIIGYYGALTTSWFDFDLFFNLVQAHQEWEFILIGLIYQDTEKTKLLINDLQKNNNFTYLPPIPYEEIPDYAAHFSVATIPFLINEITLSTNPVKLFEYMAMGLPIVTTPMPECKLYKSCLIAEKADDFADRIKEALNLKTNWEYQNILKKEATENTWASRVSDILKIIEREYEQ